MPRSDQGSGDAEHTDAAQRPKIVQVAFLLLCTIAIMRLFAAAPPTIEGISEAALVMGVFIMLLLPIAIVFMEIEIALKQKYA